MSNMKSFCSCLSCIPHLNRRSIRIHLSGGGNIEEESKNNKSKEFKQTTENSSPSPSPSSVSSSNHFLLPIIHISPCEDLQQQEEEEEELKMSHSKDFRDKVILVTGSTSGIGFSLVKYFARCGAHVVINGRNQVSISKAAAECQCISPKKYPALQIKGDVTKEEDCKRLISSIINHHGRLDILINNAGAGTFGSINDPKISQTITQMFDLNVKSIVMLTQLAVPYLEKSNGVIVNISSTLSVKPNVSFMPYCVAKAAVDMFTKCIALELGPKGIRANTVNPTAVRTNFQAATGAGEILDGVLRHLEQVNPLKRIATTDDVVNAVAFLSSSESSFITGHSLMVDGASIYV